MNSNDQIKLMKGSNQVLKHMNHLQVPYSLRKEKLKFWTDHFEKQINFLVALTFALIRISNWGWSWLLSSCWSRCCRWLWCCCWSWCSCWCWCCCWSLGCCRGWRCGCWFWCCGHWDYSGIYWNDFVLQCLDDLRWELSTRLGAFSFQNTGAFAISQVVLWAVASVTCFFNTFIGSWLRLSSWELAWSRADWFFDVSFVGTTCSLC